MTINTTHNCTEPQINLIFVGVYVLVFTVGLFLNLTALVVFFCYTKLWSHTMVYMTNLAIADLLLVLTLPLRIYYHLGLSGLPQVLCEGMGLVLLVNMYGSIFLLTCMCFDRCMAVCLPMLSWVQEGRKKPRWSALGCGCSRQAPASPSTSPNAERCPRTLRSIVSGTSQYTPCSPWRSPRL
ncbi:unnamed protein product [Oncorhynchus mykiss]|uniref:G-protein coupled receptors family 1 profile domain-containing protein n=1 Tax=Oncorhynchus mykiss TaxID=8022 RepID=A0A060Y4T6_ONCMY|nr:unnamed protein product [Oncorhynchus mykiss]